MTRVLVVCTANICRSPFAGRLLAKHLAATGIVAQVSSAGTRATVGCPADERTIQVAREWYNLDLADHRALRTTQEMIDAHDLVLAMAADHVHETVARFPNAASKTITMRAAATRSRLLHQVRLAEDQWVAQLVRGAGAGRPDDDVADPYGGSLKLFRAVADDIAQLVESLVASWPGP